MPACSDLWGDPRLAAECERAFPDDCARRLACVQNDPLFAPQCPDGQVHAFASNACFAVCDDAHPCSAGACTAPVARHAGSAALSRCDATLRERERYMPSSVVDGGPAGC